MEAYSICPYYDVIADVLFRDTLPADQKILKINAII